MKASDLFGVVVRAAGLWVFIHGIWEIGYWLFVQVGLATQDPLEKYPIIETLWSGLAKAGVGLLFLRCASWWVSFSYPQPHTNEPADVITLPDTTQTGQSV